MGELGALAAEPAAGAGGRLARPSRVLATMSSRWSSASTDSIPNMARPSIGVVDALLDYVQADS